MIAVADLRAHTTCLQKRHRQVTCHVMTLPADEAYLTVFPSPSHPLESWIPLMYIPSSPPCAAGMRPVAVFFPHNTTLGASSIYRRFFKRTKSTEWITPDLLGESSRSQASRPGACCSLVPILHRPPPHCVDRQCLRAAGCMCPSSAVPQHSATRPSCNCFLPPFAYQHLPRLVNQDLDSRYVSRCSHSACVR